MTDEKLAAIREQLKRVVVYPSRTDGERLYLDAPINFARDVLALVAEVEQLQEHNTYLGEAFVDMAKQRDALLHDQGAWAEIAQAVATVPDSEYHEECVFCHAEPGYTDIQHTADCPVTKARARLTGDPSES